MPKVVMDPGWGWSQPHEYAQAIQAGHLLLLSGQMPVDGNGSLDLAVSNSGSNTVSILLSRQARPAG